MLPNSMYALVLTPAGLQLNSERPIPAPSPGEALLRIRLAGICSTDFQLTRGYKGGFQGILGHEFIAEVVAAPSAPEWVGKRVVGDINVGCGQCEICRRGLHKHCRHGNTLGINKRDGVFAEYATLPVANLYAVPDSVADDQAVFVEPLAAAFEILEQAPVTQATRVYVQGDGRLGLLCALVLATTGCDLTVIGRNANKLAILEAAGIRNTVVSGTPAYENLFVQPAADIVVEATGAIEGFHSALRLTRPMGTLVLKSTYADRLTDLDISRLVVDEITLVGSRCGPFARALQALASGAIDVRPLIHARYPLHDGLAAFDHAQRKGVIKVLIDPTR